MNNKNIILFSSGNSEENGMLEQIHTAFKDLGYVCFVWRHILKMPMIRPALPFCQP